MTCHNLHCSYTPPHGCHDCPPQGVCPDLQIGRHDTKPNFRVNIADCDGPMDLTGMVLEASMWAKGRFKKSVQATDTFFSLADNIGFEQIMVGDIIVVDRPRLPEQMLVIGFDEDNYLVEVQRGYQNTTPQTWKKGQHIRILKFKSATAHTEMIFQDIIQVDGTTKNELTDTFLVYEWRPNDTCLAGCYYLEFKLIKMVEVPVTPTEEPCHRPKPGDGLPIGPATPYSVGGPYPTGSIYGPFGPYVLPGEDSDIAVDGIHGTDNYPVPPRDHYPDRDERVLEAEYRRLPNDPFDPNVNYRDPEPYPDLGNSPTTPLYPEPLNPIETGANPQFYDPAGTEGFGMMPNFVCSPSISPISFTSPSLTPTNFGCGLGSGVEWIRKFPVAQEGFLIYISESPIADI